MNTYDDVPAKIHSHERKYRRFNLNYPVRLTFSAGGSISELDAVSRNVSIGGMLLETTSKIPEHSPVRFVMTVQESHMLHAIELAGQGEVVRVEDIGVRPGFAIAVECKDPIAQVERYLPAQ